MNDYLQTRANLQVELDYFNELAREYNELQHRELPAGQLPKHCQSLLDWASSRQHETRERLANMLFDPAYRFVLDAELPMRKGQQRAEHIWRFLTSHGLMASHDTHVELSHVQAGIPPDVPVELTGATVTAFVQDLDRWFRSEAADIWEDQQWLTPLELGGRYALGDFIQTSYVCQQLNMCRALRAHWLELMQHGQVWDRLSMLSVRATLLVKAHELLRAILNPITEDAMVLSRLVDVD